MVYTIYDNAVERMKKMSSEMGEIIEELALTGKNNSLMLSYREHSAKLKSMGVWQDKYDFYMEKALSKNFLKEDRKGLAKLVKGEFE